MRFFRRLFCGFSSNGHDWTVFGLPMSYGNLRVVSGHGLLCKKCGRTREALPL